MSKKLITDALALVNSKVLPKSRPTVVKAVSTPEPVVTAKARKKSQK